MGFPITTDRHIPHNKPDIIIKEKETGICLIIDVAIPSNYNIQKKTTEKMTKHVDLQIEYQRMGDKTVGSTIIGAKGVVEKNLKKYLNRIPGSHNVYNLEIIHPRNCPYLQQDTIHQARIDSAKNYSLC